MSHTLLHYHRKLKQLTQSQVADALYALCDESELDERGVIDKAMVSRWERGVNAPGLFWQRKLCQFFGKSPEELGFVTPPPPAARPAGQDRREAARKKPISPVPEQVVPIYPVRWQKGPTSCTRRACFAPLHMSLLVPKES